MQKYSIYKDNKEFGEISVTSSGLWLIFKGEMPLVTDEIIRVYGTNSAGERLKIALAEPMDDKLVFTARFSKTSLKNQGVIGELTSFYVNEKKETQSYMANSQKPFPFIDDFENVRFVNGSWVR